MAKCDILRKDFLLMYVLAIVVLLVNIPCFGANYYVDCNASAGGDGSLATPWDAIADINGASFSAGDNIYLAKGCTFSGTTLTPPSSGSAGNVITFTSYGSGATPILTGASGIGINIASKTYVTIDGLEVSSTDTNGIAIGSGCSYITIKNCTIHDTGQNGIAVWGTSSDTTNVTIQNNTIYNAGTAHASGLGNGIILAGTDASARVESTIVEYNNVYNCGYDLHDHGIYEESYNGIVRYNTFNNNTGFGIKINNALSGGESGGGNQSYYNVVTNNDCGGILVESTTSGPVNNRIWNNTLYGNGTSDYVVAGLQYTIGTGTPTGNEWRNNIVYGTGAEHSQYFVLANTLTTGLTASNNLYYAAAEQYWRSNSTNQTTLAGWQTQISGDANSLTSNPSFFSTSDYHIHSTSPCFNVGVSVGLSQDKDGRSINGLPDLGAYEAYSGNTGFSISGGSMY